MLIQVNANDFFEALGIDYTPGITIYLSSLNPDIQKLNIVYYTLYLISIEQYYYETFLPDKHIYDNCVYIIFSKTINDDDIENKMNEIYENSLHKNIYDYNVTDYEYDFMDERYEFDNIIIPQSP